MIKLLKKIISTIKKLKSGKQLINHCYCVNNLDCNQYRYPWCKKYNSKRFQQEFSKWTSGNEYIDKFIQDTQLEAEWHWEVIEWIPYDHLRNVQYLAKGG